MKHDRLKTVISIFAIALAIFLMIAAAVAGLAIIIMAGVLVIYCIFYISIIGIIFSYVLIPQGFRLEHVLWVCPVVIVLSYMTVRLSVRKPAMITFHMKDIASYDEEQEAYILESGVYILRLGNSSRNTQAAGMIRLEETYVTAKAKNVFGKTDFIDFEPQESKVFQVPSDVDEITINREDIEPVTFCYEWITEIDPIVDSLSDEKLINLNLGAYGNDSNVASIIGNAAFTVAGAAGQTTFVTLENGIPSLVMADGPAGLRLSKGFVRDEEGAVHSVDAPLPESMIAFMGEEEKAMLKQVGYQVQEKPKVLISIPCS